MFDPRAPVTDAEGLRKYTWEEIRAHSDGEKDAWLVVHGRVYDVSKYGDLHPGGSSLLGDYAGEDATDEWEGVGFGGGHGRLRMQSEVSEIMKGLLIGRSIGDAPPVRHAPPEWKPADQSVPKGAMVAPLLAIAVAMAVCYYSLHFVSTAAGYSPVATSGIMLVVGLVFAHFAAIGLMPQG
eukprot:Hpha_TRINITY_DN15392_c2_g1::TRINITY_DN15392_c2_g1_i1::g.90543::m.90543